LIAKHRFAGEEQEMEFKLRHAYKQSVDVLFKGFGTKAVLEKKYAALGARNVEVETCKLTKTGLTTKFTREVPTNVPGMLKKFLGEWSHVTQEEHWTGTAGKSYQSNFTVAFKGVPVAITGTMVLSAEGKGCVNTVVLDVTSSVPLIGRKLAEFIGETAVAEGDAEYEYLKATL
jgi:hypothetical protein